MRLNMEEFYIKEIAKTNIGISRTRAEEKNENGIIVKFISPKAISNNSIKAEEIEQIKVQKRIYETAKKTKKGDILIKTTTPFEIVLINEEYAGLMYNSFCINLTVENLKFSEKYIYAYLNTEFIKNKLQNRAKSYRTTPISKIDIGEIKIPYIEKEKQIIIG
ncbi:MAG: restriction endonuclease subunit S, partial [Bacilli bacterium]|nr:restriction endonuclease subunit S [Bacilli bacterium]